MLTKDGRGGLSGWLFFGSRLLYLNTQAQPGEPIKAT